MNVLCTDTDGSHPGSYVFGRIVNIIQRSPLLGQGPRYLIDKGGTSQSPEILSVSGRFITKKASLPSTDDRALSLADRDVISDNNHPEFVGGRVFGDIALFGQSEVEDISGVVSALMRVVLYWLMATIYPLDDEDYAAQ
jgi:hypothetical protein